MPLAAFAGMFSRGRVAAEVDDAAWVRAMLDVEAALAGALADAGLAPAAVAAEIEDACRSGTPSPADLGRGTAAAATPVPALLAWLEARLTAEAAAQLHRGATSQDVLDTAAVLVAQRALAPLLADLDAAVLAAAGLADAHRTTLKPGRTLMQQALPTTFGLDAAVWVDTLGSAGERLRAAGSRAAVSQLGGAVGTLAALGDRAAAVSAAFAARLDLGEPPLPWHANRGRPADLAAALGVAAGAAGKVGLDLLLLAQTEIAELSPGRPGGSSTMPQKRNSPSAVAAVACARRTPQLVATMLGAMLCESERSAGAWQVEAEALGELLRLTGSGLDAAAAALREVEIDRERMRANLDAGGGTLMAEALAGALRAELGRPAAHERAAAATARSAERGVSYLEAALEDPEIAAMLGLEGVREALDPSRYLGATEALIDRALAAHPGAGR